jgi:hypothetical protein
MSSEESRQAEIIERLTKENERLQAEIERLRGHSPAGFIEMIDGTAAYGLPEFFICSVRTVAGE